MEITFRGWSVRRAGPWGMYRAERLGRLPLAADTLTGLKELIRRAGDGDLR